MKKALLIKKILLITLCLGAHVMFQNMNASLSFFGSLQLTDADRRQMAEDTRRRMEREGLPEDQIRDIEESILTESFEEIRVTRCSRVLPNDPKIRAIKATIRTLKDQLEMAHDFNKDQLEEVILMLYKLDIFAKDLHPSLLKMLEDKKYLEEESDRTNRTATQAKEAARMEMQRKLRSLPE